MCSLARAIFASSCCLAFIGCNSSDQGISRVSGTVQINGSAAPEGTFVRFSNVTNESDAFLTAVNSEGHYDYVPPQQVLLAAGNYRVALLPLRRRTEVGANNMSRDVVIVGAPVSYGDYSDPQTSGLQVELRAGQDEIFDIEITTKTK